MIELQVLSSDDWVLWRELRLHALAEAPYAFTSTLAEWEQADEARWRARLSAPTFNVVANLHGTPTGMASGYPTDDGASVTLGSVWVAPTGRGRGVGDQLVAAVEEWARLLPADTIRLSMGQANDRALGLYIRRGFTGSDGQTGPPSGRAGREFSMWKSLR